MNEISIVSQYELLKIILDFCGNLLWPLTVLIIVIIFRKAFLNLINRAKKMELPGGVSFEIFESEIKQTKEIAEYIVSERNAKTKGIIKKLDERSDSYANKRMIEVGLIPSPSGLELDYYKSIADNDPRLAMAGLRLDFELMLRNLAKGFDIKTNKKEPIQKLISKLLKENAITSQQYEFLNKVFNISSQAIHGFPITKKQAYEVLDIGQVLVDDYLAWLDWGFTNN